MQYIRQSVRGQLETAVAIDPQRYRDIMARHPAGVTVVTANRNGRAFGLTVSAFTAVSLDPPLVLVCVDHESNTLPAIRDSGAFTVNLLAAGADDIALHFASKAGDKFAGLNGTRVVASPTGPVLATAVTGHMECRVVQEVEAGDHVVFVAAVDRAEIVEGSQPLLYCDRAFRDMVPRL